MRQTVLLILFQLLLATIALAACPCGYDSEGNCVYDSCTSDQLSLITPDQISSLTPTQAAQYFDQLGTDQRKSLSSDQLSAVIQQKSPTALGDLGNYNSEALVSALQNQGYDISQLGGNLQGANFENNILILPDGSRYDAESGQRISLEISPEGATSYFSNNDPSTPISFTNAEGVNFAKGELSISEAQSLIYYGSQLNILSMFSGRQTTFTVERADKVIIENIGFNFIKNALFTISAYQLVSANLTCEKNDTITAFRNLIPASSTYFNIYCNEEQSYALNYRKDDNETEFFGDKGILMNFWGTSNITFNATSPDAYLSIIKDVPPRYLFKNGILSFNSRAFSEQVIGNCELLETNINFITGFLRILLNPHFFLLCHGARYEYFDNVERERSFAVYNIGENVYILSLDKGNQVNISAFGNNYGIIQSGKANITLNGFIQYDRIPEKSLFPGITEAEYQKNPIIWHLVYASYDESTKASITGKDRITILADNKITENKTIIEINSGYFNIREITKNGSLHRFAIFNKKLTYPDYVERYQFNNEPLILIQNKTLTQYGVSYEGTPKIIRMFTPATKASEEFWDWFKIKTVIKNLAEFMGRTRQ